MNEPLMEEKDSKQSLRDWVEKYLETIPDGAVIAATLELSFYDHTKPGRPNQNQTWVTGRQPDPEQPYHSISSGIVC
jgi:hypothetical protein